MIRSYNAVKHRRTANVTVSKGRFQNYIIPAEAATQFFNAETAKQLSTFEIVSFTADSEDFDALIATAL